jgi:hypothetical protein
MRRKLYISLMSLVTVIAMSTARPVRAQDATACFTDGEHVNPSMCSTDCCSKKCNACASDGHYVCGPA